MSWTDIRIEKLKTLWGQGHTAAQIVDILGSTSRGSVMGKLHRLGLCNTERAVKPPPLMRPPSVTPRIKAVGRLTGHLPPATVIKKAPTPIIDDEAEVIPESERITILQLTEHTCKWPIGTPGTDNFRFCGKQKDITTPYCDGHGARAFVPAPPRKVSSHYEKVA